MTARLCLFVILSYLTICFTTPVRESQSRLTYTNTKFEVLLDVSKFPAEDVSVNVMGKQGLVVKGDDGKQKMERAFNLPPGKNYSKINSEITDGNLDITLNDRR